MYALGDPPTLSPAKDVASFCCFFRVRRQGARGDAAAATGGVPGEPLGDLRSSSRALLGPRPFEFAIVKSAQISPLLG